MENQDIHDIDNLFRDSLKDLKVPYEEDSWQGMQGKLAAASDEQVDDAVRSALSNLVVPYEAGAWQRMRDRMTKAEAAQVDQAARKAIGNLIVPYNTRSWGILFERLQQIEYRRRIIALKVLEAAVIVLALITVVRFLGVDAVEIYPSSTIETKMESNENKTMRHDIAKSDAKRNLSSLDLAVVKSSQKDIVNSDITRDEQKAPVGSSVGTVAQISSQQVKDDVSDRNQSVGRLPLENRDRPLSTVDRAELQERPSTSERTIPNPASQAPFSTHSERSKLTDLTSIPGLDFTLVQPDQAVIEVWQEKPASEEELHREALGIVSASSKVKTRIGLYSQVSRHTLATPSTNSRFPNDRIEDKLDRLGLGFIANVQFGRVGFDFGLAHEKVIFHTTATLVENEISKVQLPLHLRYNVLQKDDLKAYFKGGVVANGVILANYADLNGSASAPGIRNTTEPNERYSDGLLKRGISDNNVYWMTSFALGVEGKLAGNFSVFVEAQHQNHLHGSIGHFNTRFEKSRSLQLGILYQFN